MSVAREETFLRAEWDGDKTEISRLINVKSRRIMISVYCGKVLCAVMLARCRVKPKARKPRRSPSVVKPKSDAVSSIRQNKRTQPARSPREAMVTDTSTAPQAMATDESRPSTPVDITEPMAAAAAAAVEATQPQPMATEADREEPEEPKFNFVPMTIDDYEIDYALTDKRLRGLGLGSLCTELFLNILFCKAKKVFVGAEELEWYDERGRSFYVPQCDSPVFKYWNRIGFKRCTVEEFGSDEMDHIPLMMTLEEYNKRRKPLSIFELINMILKAMTEERIQKRLPEYSTNLEPKVRICTPWLGDFWVDCAKVSKKPL